MTLEKARRCMSINDFKMGDKFEKEYSDSEISDIELSDDDDPCSINNLSFNFNKDNIEEKVNLVNIPKTNLKVSQ